ncbi:hypothetical protein E6H20_02420 [Candidatus Bathyarchaeota archaeon]|nr:MAG: hypothetical protein E6H20_02420 [Candidatus Bathyarchaeota archaeon]
MLLLRGKGSGAPFRLLSQLILFGRKKPGEDPAPTPTPGTMTQLEPFPIPDTIRKTVTESDIANARNKLRVANLERDIIGDALTKIYEAEAKGTINEPEKNQMIQPYKNDLKRVDAEIDTYKKTVDLYELETAKEDLFKRFQETFLDIQARIEKIRPSLNLPTPSETKPAEPKRDSTKTETADPTTEEPPPPKERPREKARNKAEEKIETIREEVLKAMERLEQIETEG